MRLLLSLSLLTALALPVAGCGDQVCIQPKAGATTCPSAADAQAFVNRVECASLEGEPVQDDGLCCYSAQQPTNYDACYTDY